MKSLDLQPTKENLLKALNEDIFGRESELIEFADMLGSIEGSYSIALDSPWGSGKTFFVKQMEMLINSYNPLYKGEFKDDLAEIQNCIKRSNYSQEKIPVDQRAVYYDAWSNDNETDPLLSLIFEIAQSINSDFKFNEPLNTSDIIFDILKVFKYVPIKNFLKGTNIIDLDSVNKLKNDLTPVSLLKEFEARKNLSNLVKEFFDSLIVENANRLVIFIDELDRCRPTFAVELLERIKHYFTDDRITFVFSINKEQLIHTIKKFYGENFDACGYLNRFFDFPLTLAKPNMSKYYEKHKDDFSQSLRDIVWKSFISEYNLEIRDVNKYMSITKTLLSNLSDINFQPDAKRKAYAFSLYAVAPIMVGLKLYNLDLYNNFIKGKDNSPLLRVFSNIGYYDFVYGYLNIYDDNDDTFPVERDVALKELYKALFCKHENNKSIKVGSLLFSVDIRQKLIDRINTISKYSNYN